MFWLTRPPYLRWLAAVAVVAIAAAWDLAGRSTEPFPFAASDIPAGAGITEDLIEWRPIPHGLLTLPDLTAPVASRRIAAGEPVTESAVGGSGSVPEGWWSVPIVLPAVATPGRQVRLVILDPPTTVDGVVVASSARDVLSVADAGLVAVPATDAETVARAAAEGAITVLVRP